MKLLLEASYLLVVLTTGLRPVQGHNEGVRRHLKDPSGLKKCGVSATDADWAAQKAAVERYQALNSVAQDTIIIPVCFFSINGIRGAGNLVNTQLQAQLDVLNQGFSAASCCDTTQTWCNGECSVDTGFRFEMAIQDNFGDLIDGVTTPSVDTTNACVVRHKDVKWASGQYQDDMKRTLRKGGPTVLNVFFVDRSQSGQGVEGDATYPWDYAANSMYDGVIVDRQTIPGGTYVPYNLGKNLVHATGHWLGLLHTFDGGCTKSDGIVDTPPEADAYTGCDGNNPRDSCLADSLPDPIFNYMDFSDDVCTYQFTDGQIVVMQSCWSIYRLELGSNRPVINLPLNTLSASIDMVGAEIQDFQVGLQGLSKAGVTCKTAAPEGDASLSLYVNGNTCCDTGYVPGTSNQQCKLKLQPKGLRLLWCRTFQACSSKLKCTVSSSKTLKAEVYAYSQSVGDLTIMCSS